MSRLSLQQILAGLLVLTLCGVWTAEVSARVRLESICSIYGQKEQKLTGMGLVIGLTGTGDGGDNLPAMRALATALKLMNNPVQTTRELQNADNVAIVLIEATIPKTGLSRGQKIDCFVSSFLGATSLKGGRLLVTPIESAEIKNDSVVGLASGSIAIEDITSQTTGKIAGGIVLEQDFPSLFVTPGATPSVTLLLDAAHASFTSASEVARVINTEFSYEATTEQLAKALTPSVIQVRIPKQYEKSPVEFVAQLMEIGVDQPHSQARVIVNAKSQTVIVTGEVEISPVVISHKNLTINVGPGGGLGGNGPPFIAVPRPEDLQNSASTQSPVKLQQLVEGLNQLRVPTVDMIEIIRELQRSGKLHAVYQEY